MEWNPVRSSASVSCFNLRRKLKLSAFKATTHTHTWIEPSRTSESLGLCCSGLSVLCCAIQGNYALSHHWNIFLEPGTFVTFTQQELDCTCSEAVLEPFFNTYSRLGTFRLNTNYWGGEDIDKFADLLTTSNGVNLDVYLEGGRAEKKM